MDETDLQEGTRTGLFHDRIRSRQRHGRIITSLRLVTPNTYPTVRKTMPSMRGTGPRERDGLTVGLFIFSLWDSDCGGAVPGRELFFVLDLGPLRGELTKMRDSPVQKPDPENSPALKTFQNRPICCATLPSLCQATNPCMSGRTLPVLESAATARAATVSVSAAVRASRR